jgi:hypothetical protein
MLQFVARRGVALARRIQSRREPQLPALDGDGRAEVQSFFGVTAPLFPPPWLGVRGLEHSGGSDPQAARRGDAGFRAVKAIRAPRVYPAGRLTALDAAARVRSGDRE